MWIGETKSCVCLLPKWKHHIQSIRHFSMRFTPNLFPNWASDENQRAMEKNLHWMQYPVEKWPNQEWEEEEKILVCCFFIIEIDSVRWSEIWDRSIEIRLNWNDGASVDRRGQMHLLPKMNWNDWVYIELALQSTHEDMC